ncbi:antimicrobial peptide NK-lysin-like [Antennarius striatus]|uniref:antimicrobial peptide NK-lysin-like n=1 Tax=Antennarius striatus TaxID=241820 RepID=UPI0035ADC1F4
MMETSSVLLVCILVTCSFWTVQGRIFMVDTGDQDHVETSVVAGGLPGVCWTCKWALNNVKKSIGPNATAQIISSKLKSVCDKIGFLKSLCRKFVSGHLSELIEELSTTDDVRTICVNIRACKEKEYLNLRFYDSNESH